MYAYKAAQNARAICIGYSDRMEREFRALDLTRLYGQKRYWTTPVLADLPQYLTVPKTPKRAGVYGLCFHLGAKGFRRLTQHHRPALGKERPRVISCVGFARDFARRPFWLFEAVHGTRLIGRQRFDRRSCGQLTACLVPRLVGPLGRIGRPAAVATALLRAFFSPWQR